MAFILDGWLRANSLFEVRGASSSYWPSTIGIDGPVPVAFEAEVMQAVVGEAGPGERIVSGARIPALRRMAKAVAALRRACECLQR